MSNFHASDTVRIGLHWPTVATRILIRKLTFLSKLLSDTKDSMSFCVFTTFTMEDVYNISIIQQCRMLESPLATDLTTQCLSNPDDAVSITHSGKKLLLERDCGLLITSTVTHPLVKPIAQIAEIVSWRN